jgi:CRP-like cAMP-binding protein
MTGATFDALARTKVFRDLAPGVLEGVAAASEPISLAAGELLLGAGQEHDVYLVVEGGIRIFRATNPAGDVALGLVGPGGLVGEFAAVSGRAGSASARAAVPSVVVRVPRERFLAVVREQPQVALRLLEHMIGLVRALDERVAALKSLDHAVETALKGLLLTSL